MPVEVLKSGEGFYIPMDGPWGSKEDKAALKVANQKFNELKKTKLYVALVESHHEYTHGYWIEVKQKIVEFPDRIIKEWPEKQIEDIISDSRDQPIPTT
jgi:hypothetical protein